MAASSFALFRRYLRPRAFGPARSGPAGWLRRRPLAVAAALPLLAGLAGVPGGAGARSAAHPPVPPAQKPVPVYAVRGHEAKIPPMTPWHRPATVWPSPGTATVTLPAATADTATPLAQLGNAALAAPGRGAMRAGSLPVWAGPTGQPAVKTTGRASVPSRLRVSVASRKAAAAAGVKGVIFTVSRADGNAAAGRVHVRLDYSSFAYAYGGDYAARLHLVELPACALATPQQAACRKQTPLASADDVRTTTLGADVTVPGQPPAPSAAAVNPAVVVLAAAPSPAGSAGDFTATSLSEAGQWSAGGSNGSFDYSYPIQVPPVPGGLEPDVSLTYDSQSVDGLTSSTNNQASWIGDGWDYSPGYVEQDYQSCETKPPGATNWSASGDFCWSSNDTVTLSLNGQNTTLVQDHTTHDWHPQVDNGERVQYLTGASNGTNDGGYWVITTPDGTSYYFGLNELPGYAPNDPVTNSAWTMPVYATSSGQPCYKTTFADSYCPNAAWRWNLDYVTDPHKDAIAYFYKTETNYYARHNGTTADAAYTQAGALSKIEYGLRAGAVYSTVNPAAVVTFTTTKTRTDIPSDLACSQNVACGVISPTFWGKYQLTTIATQALRGSSLASVDSWALAQEYPATGDITSAPSLWLKSITRTGQDTGGGGPSVKLPAVSFAGQALPNRIESQAELKDGYSIITRFRLTKIINETGGVTSVNYLAPSGGCTSGSLPAPDANTLLCYPDYWSPTAGKPVLDWFNKYVVNEISQQDTTGNAPDVVTTYSYNGAGWHYDDDPLTQYPTWDQWRGFRQVTTYTGPATAPDTKTTDTYFQGMDGDYQSGGGTSSVSLTSSHGDTVTDSDQFAGMDFEHIVYDGPTGGMVSDTITIPWSSAATATQTQPSPLPALTAHLTGTAETKTYTALASGGNREATITYTHDSYGRVTTTSSVPDTSDTSEDTCTTTTYASNTSAWILDLPAEVQVVSVPCGTTPTLPADAVSDDLTFYDGATSLSADTPVSGDITQTQEATSYNGSTPVYTTESSSTYDEYGRVLTAKDADERETRTAYTPATGAEPTSVQVTDPMGLVTTTTYDPARDLPLTVKNPAGWATTTAYDGLGRVTAIWTPGHPSNSSAEYTFSYDICGPETSPPPPSCSGSALALTVVTSSTLEPDGTSYLPSQTFYDSLGRVRETQAETADGNRDVTDTIYNADGWTALVSNAYYANGAPGTCPGSTTPPCLVGSPDDEVPSQTGYVYDGAGRVTRQIAYALSDETWETDTAYGGDYTTTTYKNLMPDQPTGGTPQTTFTNGLGLTSKIYQYHQGVPADPSDPPSDYDQTSYVYTPAGQLSSITDAARNTWSYIYDLAGDQKTQTDPDAGTTHSRYDAAGQLMSVTDARDDQISYTYDLDGRKTAEYNTTGGAAESSSDELASWTYDTLAKGQPTSATSYYNGSAYTEQIAGGYNPYGLPKGSETIIPKAQGKLAGTYITADSYNAATGLISSYEDSAAGGLPQETVGYGLNPAAEPTSAGGYVTNLTYTELGQPQEYTLGSGSDAWMTDTWDPQTGLLAGQLTQSQTGTSPVTVDDQHYTYDNTGQITSEADTPSGGATQVQCFIYDYLGRLSQAWSQGNASCSGGPSQQAESGAAAPYWEHYSYNVENDMTGQTSTPPSGPATTITNTFPATTGADGPHAIASQTTTGPPGTTKSSFSYNADGDLTSVSGSQAQTLSWDDADRLAQLTTSAGTTSYVYDAGGNLLIRKDPSSSTLYLPDEDITLTGTVLSATRYYSIGGQTIAARTSAGAVYYLTGDQQGTQTLAVNAQSLAVSQRFYDPFGNPVGAPPSSWPGDKGFQNGPADTTTGLDNLGAREYDPATANFISPDPLLTPANPQDLNPYAYAADTPPTGQDPTGQFLVGSGSGCGIITSCNSGGASGGSQSGTSGAEPGRAPAGGPSALLPAAVVPAFGAFLSTFRADYPGLTGPQAQLVELRSFCDQTQSMMNACGRSLSIKLLTLSESLAAMAVGLFGAPGFGGGEGEGDEPGTSAIEANIEQVAQADLNQLAADESSEEASKLVYRGGSAQPANLTPRPGVDTTGLSTFDNPEAAAPNGGKVQVIDTSQLKLLEAFPDAPPEGHVSLAPSDSSLIDEWAATRGTDEISPFTQDILDAIIGVIRVPSP